MSVHRFLPLLVVLLTSLSTYAYDFQSGDLYYNITSTNTVEVTYQESSSSSNDQGLTTATIPETVTYNGTTYSVTSIREWAFWQCSALTSITIPNSVTSIGYGAFSWCSSLTSITIPDSVTSIGDVAFGGCSALTSVTLGNSVTSIGRYAFYGCSALTSIILPNSVKTIGKYAFSDVPNIVYHGKAKGSPWGAKSVNGYVDGYLVYADDTKTKLLVCSAAARGEITIPNSVKSIENHAFGGCSALTSITIPNSVKTIGKYAFLGVPNIVYQGKAKCSPRGAKSVNGYIDGYLVYADDTKTKLLACSAAARGEITIPNSVKSIGDRAFQDCRSLTSITIPNSVKHIGSCSFSGCNQLKNIYCYATTPPNCYSNATFDGIGRGCRIHVPKGTVKSYRVASGWCVFEYFCEVSEE